MCAFLDLQQPFEIEMDSGDSGLASIKGLALRYPGYRNVELSPRGTQLP
jgi:hypothetical protein